ncbi:MAG: type II secretion system F family protein [Proteobacteria bacterium]|nr:type II secretion system F family protein [Pseudomonadota bacterium]
MATPNGRIVENTLISDSKATLKERLEKDGNFVLEIKKIKGSATLIKKARGNIRLKEKELYSFNLEFSVLLRAGLSVVSALDAIIGKDDKSDLNELLKVIRIDIAHGESLSNAFANYSHIFSNFYIANLKAGEKSGDVPLVLTRYIDYLKRVAAIRQKVISASIYPLILLTASVFVLAFLLIFVVPSITGTFAGTGATLPHITQMLLDISHFIKGNFLWFFFLVAISSFGALYYRKTPRGNMAIDRAFLSVPFLGTLYINYSTSKLSRTLATILSGGVTLIDSLKIACGILDNRYLQNKIEDILKNLKEGEGFSESMKKTGVFPDLAVRMIAAGENSGALEQILNDVADFYEGDVETKLSILTSAIEPALMIIMGLAIGFIVMAMYMPIFQMAGTIG